MHYPSWIWIFGLCASSPGFTAQAVKQKLSETGLYTDIQTKQIVESHFPFSPQYPLWSDGAVKRRWVKLPTGGLIRNGNGDGSPDELGGSPDRWIFPKGTKFWKEFSFPKKNGSGLHRVETRYLEKLKDGSWSVATYLWNEEETEATLAPEDGIESYYPLTETISHDIPSLSQCRFCHNRGGDSVLGFDLLQLSTDRDPLAPHGTELPNGALTLKELVDKKWLSYAPNSFISHPPRIVAKNELGRAAMGYLHGNCGHCHNPQGTAAFTEQYLRHETNLKPEPAYETTVDKLTKRFNIPGVAESYRIRKGEIDLSAVHYRMKVSDDDKMPPVGRNTVDAEAVELIKQWIESLGEQGE